MNNVEIILGPPGTGKTSTLLNIMDDALTAGVPVKKIAFISFTKRAIKEARERVKKKFTLQDKDIQNFRTLHSFAFRQLGLSSKHLMKKQNYSELAEILGVDITGADLDTLLDSEDMAPVPLLGDRALFIDGIARNKRCTLKSAWEAFTNDDLDYFEVEKVSVGLRLYKTTYSLLDYTDILEKFLVDPLSIDLDLLLIDETQDLSALQWGVVEKLMAVSKKTYIAGDDDQAIFRWAGADIEKFINLQGNIRTLNTSYRLPKEIHAFSKSILSNISFRRVKEYNSNAEKGTVNYINDLDSLDFSKQTWLILARSGYSLMPYIAFANENNFFYSFKTHGNNASYACRAIKTYIKLQKGYYVDDQDKKILGSFTTRAFDKTVDWEIGLDLMPIEMKYKYTLFQKEGEDLFSPRIQFSTIHGAKGAEADNVVISPDLSYKAYNEMLANPDDEARVFYVGVTRAKQNLYILTPQTRYYYEL
jgi:DNA helicase-2/ATP-dependent DNA helicase PcrA